MRILVLVLFVGLSEAKVTSANSDIDWLKYKIEYEKMYETLAEERKRRLIWEDNMALINKHNLEATRGQHSYTLGQGPFTDLTNEEFQVKISCVHRFNLTESATSYNTEAPLSIDWRRFGVVTRVKNQESCGSCWAFATTATVESRQAIRTRRYPQDLSPQQIVDCDAGDYGCHGGYPYKALQYLERYGAMNWNSYLYANAQQACQYRRSKVVARVSNVRWIQGNEEEMRLEVGNYGPVAVSIHAGTSSFQHYRSGVYDNRRCPTDTNHAVTIVGYGVEGGRDFWLIKNSWGTYWGDRGYMKIERNRNICGIATQAAFSNAW